MTALPPLSRDELLRYSRHLVLPDVGVDGQRRIKAARVLLVGAGGLGSPAALYLAAAGVGTLGLVDFDVVDIRICNAKCCTAPATSAGPSSSRRATASTISIRTCNVETHETRLTSRECARDHSAPTTSSSTAPTTSRRAISTNDACVLLGKPNVYGTIFRFEGQASVFATPDGPCYRCLFREPPPPGLVPSCAEGGVLGVLPGLVGTIQATETLKLILGIGEPLVGRLLLVDALQHALPHACSVQRDPDVSRLRHARDHVADRLR